MPSGVEGLSHRERPLEVLPRPAEVPLDPEQVAQAVQAAGQCGVPLGVAVLGVEGLVHRQRPLEVSPRPS